MILLLMREGCCSGTPRRDGEGGGVKSFADVGRQVEAELTLIIPSSCGRAWACVKPPGSETLLRGQKILWK